jgi:hypothetical protein
MRLFVMGVTNTQLLVGWQMSLSGHRTHARAANPPTNPCFSAQFIAIKESELYSSLWAACDDPLGAARE